MSLQDFTSIDLIKELGIDQLPEEEQTQMLTQMNEVLQQRILLRVFEEMSEEVKAEFNAMVESGEQPQKIGAFLQEKIPSLDEVALQETERYKQEIMNLTGKTL